MEIAPGVHHIQKARGPNIYLLADQDLTLIDTGFPGNGRAVVEYIEGLGWHAKGLKRILVTHSHPDHTGSVNELKALSSAQVLAHPADTKRDGQGQPLLSYLNLFGALPFPIPFLGKVYADGFVEDGQVLPILGGLRVIHTPGHTPGSVCFYLESRGIIFLGDMVVNRGDYVGSSMPYPKADMRQYEESLRRIARLDFRVACLAHGRVLQSDADRRIRRVLASYLSMPLWLRILRAVPPVLRLGRQTGFREP